MTANNLDPVVFEFERVLDGIPARVFDFRPPEGAPRQPGQAFAVAFSGGLDSTVLLHLAAHYAAAKGFSLFAFHVHHGLRPDADAWLSHCRNACEKVGARFDAQHVHVDLAQKEGVEALARRARYAALDAMCRQHGVNLLMTAHHADDQVETFLLQLLRGAGVAGLSGMEVLGAFPGVENGEGTQLLRPLLAVSRQALHEVAAKYTLAYVEDDSNADTRYARNALRLEVLPALSAHFPGFERRVARSVAHAQSAQRLLQDLAEIDWVACHDGEALDVQRMAALSEERFDNLFRYWMDRQGLRMPSTAWLRQARAQLLDAREDAQILLTLPGAEIRRYRHHLFFQAVQYPDAVHQAPAPQTLLWQGEERLLLAAYGGALLLTPGSEGVDATWLLAQPLRVGAYDGKARLKVNARRPTRDLKAHYQEKGVPPWERQRLPLLYAGDELLFAAGIGMAVAYAGKGGKRVKIGWEPDAK